MFEEVERFIELRPDEPVSPRHMNIKWTRKAPPRLVPRRRDQAYGRNLHPGDSLVASIVGLSAIAEGREREVPTSDVCGPTLALPAPSPADALQPQGLSLHQEPQQQGPEPGSRLPQDTGAEVAGIAVASSQARGQLPAEHSAKDAALLLQKLQLQSRKTDSPDCDDDLRASLSHDVVASTATTMCNMDSCVSGPHRPQLSQAPGAEYEDDEDEVNSAEGRDYDTGSPDHRVALLGQARSAGQAAAATRSTASTPQHAAAQSAMPLLPGGGDMASAASRSSHAMEAAMRSQESLNANRSYVGVEPRRRQSGVNIATAMPPPQPPQHRAPAGMEIVAEGAYAAAAAAELDAIGLLAATAHQHQQPPPPPHPPAANIPSRYVATRQHPNTVNLQAGQLPPPYPLLHQHIPQQGTTDAAVGTHPMGTYAGTHPAGPHGLHHHAPQLCAQHPAHAAAVAAAAAHPYGATSYAHPPPAYMTAANGGAYPLPPSVPSSLRDYPMAGPPTRPGTSGGGAAAGAQVRYGSQPPSGHQSLDSGQYPASGATWDNVSLADTEPLPGAPGRRGRRGTRRRGAGLFGLVRNVVGFVGVSMLSGAAMVLGAAAVNTGLDEQEAAQNARQRHGEAGGARRGQRLGRGGDDLIPQRTLQQLRSPDLLALGRG